MRITNNLHAQAKQLAAKITSLVATALLAIVGLTAAYFVHSADAQGSVYEPEAFVMVVKTDNLTSYSTPYNQFRVSTVHDSDYNYNYNVDCDSDGTIDHSAATNDVFCSYPQAGTYTVAITGDFPRIDFSNRYSDNLKLLEVKQWGDITWESMEAAFNRTYNMQVTASDTPDLSAVTSARAMFKGASSFSADLSDWDTSRVTDMSEMFSGANSFNGDISDWDTSSVTDMFGMFRDTPEFNQDISSWDTSNVTDMGYMFDYAISFNSSLSSWDTSSVTNMNGMFNNATAFNQDLSSWKTSNVVNMASMFNSVTDFNGDISSWDTGNVTDMSYMFIYAISFNSSLSSWDTSSVASMTSMFYGAANFNGDISSWDTGNVTDMSRMFGQEGSSGAGPGGPEPLSVGIYRANEFGNKASFNQDISDWDTSSVVSMSEMFAGNTNFDQSLGSWDIGSVRDMYGMFAGAKLSTVNYDATLAGWASQDVQPDIRFDGGSSQYDQAEAARTYLVEERNWTIQDGGRPGSIQDVELHEEAGKKLLNIRGVDLINSDDIFGPEGGMFVASFVSLNGQPLPFCTDRIEGMTAETFINEMGVAPGLVSDTPACYYAVDYSLEAQESGGEPTFLLTSTQAIIWLPDDFDIAALGTVSVNGSPAFAFNQPEEPEQPAEPTVTAKVDQKDLTTKPAISKRPTFTGTAPAGSTVVVTVHSDPITCTTTADANGYWSCTLPEDLEPGNHTVHVVVFSTDGQTIALDPYPVTVAGPTGESTAPGTTVDGQIPGAPNTGVGRMVANFAAASANQAWGVIVGGLAAAAAALWIGLRRRSVQR